MPLRRGYAPDKVVKVCQTDARLLAPVGDCLCAGDPKLTYPKRLVLQLKRKGADAWQIEYPAFDVEDGWIDFRLDRLFLESCPGRYDARLLMDKCECGTFSVELTTPRCSVDAGQLVTERRKEPRFSIEYPPGVTDMFDTIVTFSGFLVRPLERSDQLLPLCEDGRSQLCALDLCKPVQLLISDGVHEELVEFEKCEEHGGVKQPVVKRGMGDTQPYRFPRGALVKFVWSTDNVLRAREGC